MLQKICLVNTLVKRHSGSGLNSLGKKVRLSANLLLSMFMLNACSTLSSDGDNASIYTGTLLFFDEREQGGAKFKSNIFVSSQYIRISDDSNPKDYLLFDREKRTIYNLNAEDKTIFVIKPKPITQKKPISIEFKEVAQPSSAIPKVQGNSATHYRYYVNDKHCYDSVSLGFDFMPDVVKAFKEFRTVLAGEHASSLGRMPKETIDACDLAMNIFHTTQHLEHGLPLREWDRKGYQRFMYDFRIGFKMNSNLFVLPEDFERYSISQ